MICHIQNEILKQKHFIGSEFEGTQTFLKVFSRDYFYVKTMRHSRFQLGQFFVHWFEIWQFYSKITEVQNRVSVFGNFETFSSYHNKTPPLSIAKVLF